MGRFVPSRILCISALLGAALALEAGGRLFAGDEPLLDEIAKHIDANRRLMRQGSAQYREMRYRYANGVKQPPEQIVVDMTFLDDRYCWREHREGNIADEWHLTHELGVYWIQPADRDQPPTDNSIILFPHAAGRALPRFSDPRTLGHGVVRHGDSFDSLAELIRAVRKPSSVRRLRVKRDGNAIKVVSLFPDEAQVPNNVRATKDESWIDPSQGYSVVRVKQWGRPEHPAVECETRYEQASNGAWVARRFERTRYVLDGNHYSPKERNEVDLIEIDFATRLSPGDFTLTGLGLPKGSRVQDRIQNREYLLGFADANEQALEAERTRIKREHIDSLAARPGHRRQLAIVLVVMALAAGIVVVIRRVRAKYASRRRSASQHS